MAFGEQLQAVRRANGLTQEQFAEQLCVSRQAVSKWESGRGYPEVEKILDICNRYNVTPNELFCQEVPHVVCPPQSTAERETAPEGTACGQAERGDTSTAKNRWTALAVLSGTLILSLVIGVLLKKGSMDMSPIIWVGVMVAFAVVEAITVGLTSIWFVCGAVGGLAVAMLNGPIWLQLVLFFAVSIGCMVAARPLVSKYINQKTVATNADRVLNSSARVTETIDNTVPAGAVYADGKTWSARSETGELIEAGAIVRVKRIEGVRLFVELWESSEKGHQEYC